MQAALAAARTRGSYLKARYHRIAARRGKRRAAVAVARSLLEIAYYLLHRREVYRELGRNTSTSWTASAPASGSCIVWNASGSPSR